MGLSKSVRRLLSISYYQGACHYLNRKAGCLAEILKGLVDLMVLKCEDDEKVHCRK